MEVKQQKSRTISLSEDANSSNFHLKHSANLNGHRSHTLRVHYRQLDSHLEDISTDDVTCIFRAAI